MPSSNTSSASSRAVHLDCRNKRSASARRCCRPARCRTGVPTTRISYTRRLPSASASCAKRRSTSVCTLVSSGAACASRSRASVPSGDPPRRRRSTSSSSTLPRDRFECARSSRGTSTSMSTTRTMRHRSICRARAKTSCRPASTASCTMSSTAAATRAMPTP